jgi:hypothetical protein
MASGSSSYSGINAGRAARAGKGKSSPAKQRAKETKKQGEARREKTGNPF